MTSIERRKLTISVGNQAHNIVWYPGTTDQEVEAAIKNAVGYDDRASISVFDATDDTQLAINEFLPDGLVVRISQNSPDVIPPVSADANPFLEKAKTEDWLDVKSFGLAGGAGTGTGKLRDEEAPLLEKPSSNIQQTDKEKSLTTVPETTPSSSIAGVDKEMTFQKQLLKFDRLNAHLANERTWLAWIRTTFSLLTCAITLQAESEDASTTTWHRMLYFTGCLCIVAMEMTYLTGWSRYAKVKDILKLNKSDLQPKMGRLKIKYQTQVTFATLVLIAVLYWVGGWSEF